MDLHTPATLDHIYKFLTNESEFDCEHICSVIQRETGRLAQVYRFVELCLFDALIGNHDRHGRNIALITKAGSTRVLAPFYDNPSYIGIADEATLSSDHRPRGAIHTASSSEPTLADYVIEFKRMELNQTVMKFRQNILSKSRFIFSVISGDRILSEPRKKALLHLIEKRLQEFEDV